MNLRIILASSSPRRKELLSRFVKDFTIEAADIDETMEPELSPAEATLAVAEKKAEKVYKTAPDNSLIIAADTSVFYGSKTYGKPEKAGKAREFLNELRGKSHRVITGVVCMEKPSGRTIKFTESTTVKFVNYSDETIEKYIATGEPLDRAGSYAIQGIGCILVESVTGDYDNVVGLPVARLVRELANVGIFLF